jgi:hypothetical protein
MTRAMKVQFVRKDLTAEKQLDIREVRRKKLVNGGPF